MKIITHLNNQENKMTAPILTPITIPTEVAEKPLDHYQIRNAKVSEIKNKFKEHVKLYPELQLALLDASEFLTDFYWDQKPKTLEINSFINIDCFSLELSNTQDEKYGKYTYTSHTHGFIFFYGNGKWKYEFNVKTTTDNETIIHHDDNLKYEFTGNGPLMGFHREGKSDYVLSLNEELEKLLVIPEPFSKDYNPLYAINTNPHYHMENKVKWGWRLGYYDGPLSGYCYLNKKMYYYDMVDEKDYSGDRMYALYELSNWQKVRAYICHYAWLKFGPYKMKRKVYDFVARIFKNKDLNKKSPVGYFTY
jgi:hypothetical protein